MSQYRVELDMYTDGSCKPFGFGAYAAYMQWGTAYNVIYQAFANTTIGRMELQAVVAGLEALTDPSVVHLHSDSQYVVNTISAGWIWNWAKKGWAKADGNPVKHRDLMERLIVQLLRHKVDANWVPGHAGVWQNELCDSIAQKAASALAAA